MLSLLTYSRRRLPRSAEDLVRLHKAVPIYLIDSSSFFEGQYFSVIDIIEVGSEAFSVL